MTKLSKLYLAGLLSLLCSCTTRYNGIDISHHNDVEWSSIPGNVEFCYIKATEGKSYVDPMYKQHSVNAKSKGIKVGFYHYYRTSVPALQQFKNFRGVISSQTYDLIPVIDIEDNGNSYKNLEWEKDNIKELCDLFKSEYGYYPIVYYGEVFDSARKTIGTVKGLKIWNRTMYNPFSFIKNAVITQKAIKKFGQCEIDVNYCPDLSEIVSK